MLSMALGEPVMAACQNRVRRQANTLPGVPHRVGILQAHAAGFPWGPCRSGTSSPGAFLNIAIVRRAAECAARNIAAAVGRGSGQDFDVAAGDDIGGRAVTAESADQRRIGGSLGVVVTKIAGVIEGALHVLAAVVAVKISRGVACHSADCPARSRQPAAPVCRRGARWRRAERWCCSARSHRRRGCGRRTPVACCSTGTRAFMPSPPPSALAVNAPAASE